MPHQTKRSDVPVALTIAGSDCSAGAGIQADLKTFGTFGVYGLTTVTCVVSEVPGQVTGIVPVPAEIVADQVRLSLEAFPVRAVKTGMLYSAEIAILVAGLIEKRGGLTLVVDPVMVATSGDALIEPEVLKVYRASLFRLATLVTPNRNEVETLIGREVADLDDYRACGERLAAEYKTAFLLKGGHFPGEVARDMLFAGGELTEFVAPFVHGVSTHGTGCTYSAAITANLAKGLPLKEAVRSAKEFITRAIGGQFVWQSPIGQRVSALNVFPPGVFSK